MKIQPIYLDLCPDYIPFLVQATKADGGKADPSADNLIIYEEGGADGTFDSTDITSSPFDPAKVNSKTGLWGVLVPKSELTAGKFYIALWEMTVDSKTTAKVEIFFACNASDFMADVSSLASQDSVDTVDGIVDDIVEDTNELQALIADSKLPAQVAGIDDIDFPATQLASIESSVVAAINTACPATITVNSLYDKADDIQTDVTAVKGEGFTTEADSLHILRNRGDEYWATGDIGSVPTVGEITEGMEESGGKLDAVFQTVGAFLDTTVSSRASLGDGNVDVTFEVTNDATDEPVPDVLVQVRATDDTTAAVIASGYTSDAGEITFRLNDGETYYFFRRKAGMTFTDPVEVIVSA